ncbi:hypothetical protein E4K10_20760 [Streptomyces sp. T1317-0309]|nr:hypothetical protein E4K10_20760 [Streptomyces sp. T1317-0309]
MLIDPYAVLHALLRAEAARSTKPRTTTEPEAETGEQPPPATTRPRRTASSTHGGRPRAGRPLPLPTRPRPAAGAREPAVHKGDHHRREPRDGCGRSRPVAPHQP